MNLIEMQWFRTYRCFNLYVSLTFVKFNGLNIISYCKLCRNTLDKMY